MSPLGLEHESPAGLSQTTVRPQRRRKNKPEKEPRYNVVLWNDDVHTFEYVALMLRTLFGYPLEQGFQLALEVDTRGKAIVFTSSLGQAEIKKDQILAFGADPLIAESSGPLCATLEKNP